MNKLHIILICLFILILSTVLGKYFLNNSSNFVKASHQPQIQPEIEKYKTDVISVGDQNSNQSSSLPNLQKPIQDIGSTINKAINLGLDESSTINFDLDNKSEIKGLILDLTVQEANDQLMGINENFFELLVNNKLVFQRSARSIASRTRHHYTVPLTESNQDKSLNISFVFNSDEYWPAPEIIIDSISTFSSDDYDNLRSPQSDCLKPLEKIVFDDWFKQKNYFFESTLSEKNSSSCILKVDPQISLTNALGIKIAENSDLINFEKIAVPNMEFDNNSVNVEVLSLDGSLIDSYTLDLPDKQSRGKYSLVDNTLNVHLINFENITIQPVAEFFYKSYFHQQEILEQIQIRLTSVEDNIYSKSIDLAWCSDSDCVQKNVKDDSGQIFWKTRVGLQVVEMFRIKN